MWWRKGDNAAVEEDGDNILIEHDEADDDIEGGLIENREDDEDEEDEEDDEQDDDFNQGDINGYDNYDYAFEDEWAELEATKEAKVVTPGCCYVASGASFFICIISVLVIVGVVLDDGDVTPKEKIVDKDTLEYILPVVAGIPGMIGLALLLCGIVVWRRNKFLYSQLEKHRSTTYEMDDINNAESAGLVSNEDTNTNSTSFEQNDLNDEDITLNNIEDEDVGIIEREDNVVSLSLDEDDEENEEEQEEQETEEERLAREAEQRIIEEEEARAIAMLMQTSNTAIPTKKEAPNTNYDNTSNNNDNNNAHVSSVNDNKQPELSEASELPITENDEDDDFDDDDDDDEEDDEIELTFE